MTILRLGDGTIDWALARRRLEEAQQALEEALRPDGERARAILDERARRLAAPIAEPRRPADVLEIVTFSLGDELFGISSQFVREVVGLPNITPVPGAPRFLLGLSNLRGTILAVLDLLPLFGRTRTGLADLTRLLVLGLEQPEFGLVADAVRDWQVISRDELSEPPQSLDNNTRRYFVGLTKTATAVLDGEALLADPSLVIDDEPQETRLVQPMGQTQLESQR
jgi:purine-binding chemotaxis protein CheW